MNEPNRAGRGKASRKFYRAPAKGEAQAKRVQFGKTWGAFNSATAKQLRRGGR